MPNAAANSTSRSRAAAFGLGALVVLTTLGASAWWLVGAPGGGSTPQQEPEPLRGYAPTPPATEAAALRYDVEYPAIPYTRGARTDRVAELIARVERGEVRLEHDGERGYLTSLLAALDISPASQTLVFSQTSLQSRLISPRAPRAIYFNDDVYVAFVQGAPLEIASMDPELGPVFYVLPQDAPQAKLDVEVGRCLACHDSYSLTGGGVPRFIVGSGYTGTTGMLVAHEGWILTSDRTPLKNRFGGWYVTGEHGSQVHLGNVIIKSMDDFNRLDELRLGNVATLDDLVDTTPYLTNTSDIVALLVMQHQVGVQNLITRLRYDALSAAERREQPLEETVEDLLRAMLFVDAVELTAPVSGNAEFVEQFERRALRDSQGRSLRDFDLTRRLFKYPLSYVIYSPAFDALPTDAKDAFLRRLNAVLSGADTSDEFAHLSAAERGAILEILRETKPELVAGAVH